MKARATRATTAAAATAVMERPRRVPVPAATAECDEHRRANAAIVRIAHPPAACPACCQERGEAFPRGYTTRTCRWHELVGWVTLATRNPALWPRVRAQFGEVVLLRLTDGNGTLLVDIAVR